MKSIYNFMVSVPLSDLQRTGNTLQIDVDLLAIAASCLFDSDSVQVRVVEARFVAQSRADSSLMKVSA